MTITTAQSNLAKISNYIAKAEKLIAEKNLEDGDLQLLIDLDAGSLNTALALGGVNKSVSSETALKILQNTQKWASKQGDAWLKKEGSFTAAYLITAFCKKYVTAK